MYTEVIIARSEYQLMQKDLAQQSQRDGFVVEGKKYPLLSLRTWLSRLFTRIQTASNQQQPISTDTQHA